MWQEACIVSVSGSSTADLGDVSGHSCSGAIVNGPQGLVLSHGVAFSPYLPAGFTSQHVRQQGWYRPEETDSINVSVVVRPRSGHQGTPEKKCSAQLLLLWRCDDFHNAVQKLMPKHEGWHFEESPNNKDANGRDTSHQIQPVQSSVKADWLGEVSLSWFALLQLEDWRSGDSSVVVSPEQARIGSPVVVVGTPFGTLCPSVFMNSLAKGIVCNTTGEGGALILTDARCLPGTEGSPLLSLDREGNWLLLGIVAAPLCWKANEWVGLSLVCSLHAAVESLSHLLPSPVIATVDAHSTKTDVQKNTGVSRVGKSVVMVEAGGMWGSGVIVHVNRSKVYLLTCRHVLGSLSATRVNVVLYHEQKVRVPGNVVYVTPSESVYDLAVVEFPNPGVDLVPVKATTRYTKGEDCYAVGHALFGQNQQLKPTVTSGVLSNVVSYKHHPTMLQSTCAVHAGVSGGALFNDTGKLMGIVVSNAKDVQLKACYPHLNFVIPSTVFVKPVKRFIQTKDVGCLSELDSRNKFLQDVWNLQEPKLFLQSKM